MRHFIEIDPERCKACMLCIETCPKSVIEQGQDFNEKGYRVAVPAHIENCIGCRQCAIVCPDVAITVYREDDNA